MAVKGENQNSVIGEGSVFEGKFYIAGSLRVDGKFEGEIETHEDMIIGDTGKVKTNIKAKRVIVSGVVIGNIEASEEVRLMKNGKVLGNTVTPRIQIQDGVMAQGEIRILGDSGRKEDIKRLIEDEYSSQKVISIESAERKG